MSESFHNSVEAYDIETEIGRDELTILYNGIRKSDGKPVVIRVVAPQFTFDTYFAMRFKDAAKRALQLDHPNIVKLYDVGQKDDILYISREVVEGDTLREHLAKYGPISVMNLIGLVKQIASALDYAHAKGIKHGDLSDTTVFLSDNHVWITEFGLSAAMEGTSLVKRGFAVGNPSYLSPERVKGESISRTADLYALGILCYQMLVGIPPFSGEASAVMHSQIYDQPEPPHQVNPLVSPAVSDVVLRMLSKGLELRHSTGAEFARALEVAARGTAPLKSEPAHIKPEPAIPQTRLPVWRRLVFWIFVITPLVGCSLAAGFWAVNQWVNTGQLRPSVQVLVPTATIEQLAPASVPTFTPPAPAPTPTDVEIPAVGGSTSDEVDILPLATETPTPTPTATATPFTPPGEPVIESGSPFTNLILAGDVSGDGNPVGVSASFPPTEDPIYLFFDYETIEVGTSWRQIWTWDNIILQDSEEAWPADYGTAGTAWVYFSPALGFNPGPYTVSLEVAGEVVASVNFVVQ